MVTAALESKSSFPTPVDRLAIYHQGHSSLLTSLNDLQGHIRVASASQALRVARLRTAYATWNLWSGNIREVEVVEQSQVAAIPDFGLKGFIRPERGQSGYLGALSPAAYRAGKFSPARVTAGQNGYEITRWLFASDYSNAKTVYKILLVKEFLEADGKYRRSTLHILQPPKLPDTVWSFASER